MTDSAYRVETISRLAQWRIDNFASSSYRKSDPFKIGKWNWHLVLEKNRTLLIKLFPEIPKLARDNPPIASFSIRIVSLLGEIRDKQLKIGVDFVWKVEVPLAGRFIIDVEFLDLKTVPPNVIRSSFFSVFEDFTGGEPHSIWSEGFPQKDSNSPALSSIGKMLSESIHTDIVICASDGNIGAHRAVLAARSPVFRSMFSHDLKEKEMSAINISDMSLEACEAFLSYIYSNIRHEDFLIHRLDLIRAADKYDVSDLKDACQESLLEDIDTKNVLERLQNAYLYRLPRLKVCCIEYLVKFGKIFEIREEFNGFIQSGDRELIGEVINGVLSVWEGF
ncbi:BTB/POZ-like protein [Cynara cardunculus var. scolymus]|uniref:BTB/POZ-like protein n=1 Tax=Cynara cardunculus var. scolymus TaxID=59895 RepID=A0A124SE79_CYNCS|nr:BTB/POZ-like protein [Cynara cardunculus var. scolymus]